MVNEWFRYQEDGEDVFVNMSAAYQVKFDQGGEAASIRLTGVDTPISVASATACESLKQFMQAAVLGPVRTVKFGGHVPVGQLPKR